MTAKEKAQELINRFIPNMPYANTKEWAKQCALICVDEILESELLTPQLKRHYVNGYPSTIHELEFWQEVRKEIINYK